MPRRKRPSTLTYGMMTTPPITQLEYDLKAMEMDGQEWTIVQPTCLARQHRSNRSTESSDSTTILEISSPSSTARTGTGTDIIHSLARSTQGISVPPRSSSYAAFQTPRMSSPLPIPPSMSANSSSSSSGTPLTHPRPTTDALASALPALDKMSDEQKLSWAEDVLRILERKLYPNGESSDYSSPDALLPPPKISTGLQNLLNAAVPIIISSTTHPSPSISSTASYLRGKLLASGACPDFLPRDQRSGFKDFENAARGGEARAWFRLGRDYESVGDFARAKDCFERGQTRGDVECTYRLGMAHLIGQLQLPSSPEVALRLLRTASDSCTVDFPQPAYVYGMLLSHELSSLSPIPLSLLLPPSASLEALAGQYATARQSIEKAAYLCHPPAQYKLGALYEHATLGCAYDPLLSVQWYSLASQGGEIEADMALSKWFLCGAEGLFGKNEELARTFAEKAARKGHPNGCFAMGYYFELGIGGAKDNAEAKKWYSRAAKLDNQDAISRLSALSKPSPQAFSLQEHQSHLNNTLVRRRTQAKTRSERDPSIRRPQRRTKAQAETIRMETEHAARKAAATHRQFNSAGHSPRPGEIMSPLIVHPAMLPTSTSFTRPPIPHSFSTVAISCAAPPAQLPRRPSEPAMARRLGALSPTPTPSTPPRRAAPLQETFFPNLPPPSPAIGKPKGPQTFAEMGFVSKPVEEESCIIM